MKTILYTNEENQARFYDGEPFNAKRSKYDDYPIQFEVSKKFVIGTFGDSVVIDTRNDAEL